MKGVGQQFHPRILRFGSRLVTGIKRERHHGRCRQRHRSGPAARAANRQRRSVALFAA
jgi:hypothetical protein